MRIISKKTLEFFWTRYRDSEQALKAWLNEMKSNSFKSPIEIRKRYGTADHIEDNRVVFNIKGNKYRLIVKYHYNCQIGYIRFIGTHKKYNKIDAKKI
jgi:mRNA interferase HigB